MIQQSPFPPVFTLERVTPAVEAALGAAMLARATLEAKRHAPPTQPKTGHKQLPPNPRQLELLRCLASGKNTSQRIGISLNCSTTDISNRMRTVLGRGWVEVADQIYVNGNGKRAIYRLTPEGLRWLEPKS